MKVKIESQVEDPYRIERRREQLVTAAAKCFAENGYHRTTIKEIADTAGVSPGLIYTYVKDKEDVLFLVILNVLETYLREIPRATVGVEDPIDRFCSSVRSYCEVVGRNVDATLLAYRETKSLRPERRRVVKDMEIETNKLVADCVEDCIKLGLFRPVNIHLVTYRIVLLAHGWALKEWYFRDIISLQQYIDEGLDLFLHALMTPAGWQHQQSRKTSGKQAPAPQA